MKIGKVRSVVRLMDSKIADNQELVFAIMKGPGITEKQIVKYLDYLYKVQKAQGLIQVDNIYGRAVIHFYTVVLNYDARKRKIKSSTTTRV